jgi:hypothetical protein
MLEKTTCTKLSVNLTITNILKYCKRWTRCRLDCTSNNIAGVTCVTLTLFNQTNCETPAFTSFAMTTNKDMPARISTALRTRLASSKLAGLLSLPMVDVWDQTQASEALRKTFTDFGGDFLYAMALKATSSHILGSQYGSTANQDVCLHSYISR